MIKDLESKIANIKARAERKKVKRDPSVRFTQAAVRAIDKALGATDDRPTRQALDEARTTLNAVLALHGIAGKSGGTVVPRRMRRGSGSAGLSPDVVVDHVRAHPGQRGEEIADALGTDTASLRSVTKPLIERGALKTQGERRGMRYFVG